MCKYNGCSSLESFFLPKIQGELITPSAVGWKNGLRKNGRISSRDFPKPFYKKMYRNWLFLAQMNWWDKISNSLCFQLLEVASPAKTNTLKAPCPMHRHLFSSRPRPAGAAAAAAGAKLVKTVTVAVAVVVPFFFVLFFPPFFAPFLHWKWLISIYF